MSDDDSIAIRRARHDELEWINARYAEIDFVPSGADDVVAIAEAGGQPAGLGRIVRIDHEVGELGGMLVFDAFRGAGVARRIIAFLERQGLCATLYCLPFAELEGLYASMGFARMASIDGVPAPIAAKHQWCNTHYDKPVLLMRRET